MNNVEFLEPCKRKEKGKPCAQGDNTEDEGYRLVVPMNLSSSRDFPDAPLRDEDTNKPIEHAIIDKTRSQVLECQYCGAKCRVNIDAFGYDSITTDNDESGLEVLEEEEEVEEEMSLDEEVQMDEDPLEGFDAPLGEDPLGEEEEPLFDDDELLDDTDRLDDTFGDPLGEDGEALLRDDELFDDLDEPI